MAEKPRNGFAGRLTFPITKQSVHSSPFGISSDALRVMRIKPPTCFVLDFDLCRVTSK